MQRQNNYAFIDSQNLYLGVKSQGWQLDYQRFRIYLKDKYQATKVFLFIGYLRENRSLYTFLKNAGYELIFKPTVKIKGRVKGNVDAELVLHAAAIQFQHYQQAIIVSGDGDFHCLLKFLKKHHKLRKLLIPRREKYSQLLEEFKPFHAYLNNLKHKLKR